ncbi:hypothetical protein KP509_13G051100 [Ceratopteris richardii]|uniref:Uncharacterized protein n=3 Tax=Ceratopteris richardii TaxID=49495 RepID=A0A8T2THS5_CERRI|nr:hypothetical protein KP509_13G051100 [Ceratopteris richardii]
MMGPIHITEVGVWCCQRWMLDERWKQHLVIMMESSNCAVVDRSCGYSSICAIYFLAI